MSKLPQQVNKIEAALVNGDLSRLSADERTSYFQKLCESLGLNPLSKPFEYITLNGKLTLYAKKDATDQLRKIHDVSITISDRQIADGICIVTVTATDSKGRTDSEIGVVSLKNLYGDKLANALMKAVTKAKRRVTLSICGLGFLDETEIETIPAEQKVEVTAVSNEPAQTDENDPSDAKNYYGYVFTGGEAEVDVLREEAKKRGAQVVNGTKAMSWDELEGYEKYLVQKPRRAMDVREWAENEVAA